jgi:hypothetical protein
LKFKEFILKLFKQNEPSRFISNEFILKIANMKNRKKLRRIFLLKLQIQQIEWFIKALHNRRVKKSKNDYFLKTDDSKDDSTTINNKVDHPKESFINLAQNTLKLEIDKSQLNLGQNPVNCNIEMESLIFTNEKPYEMSQDHDCELNNESNIQTLNNCSLNSSRYEEMRRSPTINTISKLNLFRNIFEDEEEIVDEEEGGKHTNNNINEHNSCNSFTNCYMNTNSYNNNYYYNHVDSVANTNDNMSSVSNIFNNSYSSIDYGSNSYSESYTISTSKFYKLNDLVSVMVNEDYFRDHCLTPNDSIENLSMNEILSTPCKRSFEKMHDNRSKLVNSTPQPKYRRLFNEFEKVKNKSTVKSLPFSSNILNQNHLFRNLNENLK